MRTYTEVAPCLLLTHALVGAGAQPHHVLDDSWMDRVVLAAEATMLVGDTNEEMDHDESFDSIRFYQDGPNRAVIATHSTGCYAALQRGTIKNGKLPIWSYASDFLTSTYENVCSSTSDDVCCSIRNQWVDAYNENARMLTFEADLTECQKNNDVPVVLSGHKFGAGLAQIAAIRLYDVVDPYFVSFSQPRVTQPASCTVRRDKWVRILNAREDLRLHIAWLVYDNNADDVPNGVLTRNAANVGHLYVVSGSDLEYWAYLGLDTPGPRRPFDRSGLASMMTTNGITDFRTLGFDPTKDSTNEGGYYDRLVATRSKFSSYETTTKSVDGFRYRALCNMDMECHSQRCARARFDAPFRCQNPQAKT